MRCPNCATDNRPHARFCRVCGQLLAETVTPPPAPRLGVGDDSEATLEIPWPLAEQSAPTAGAPAATESGGAAAADAAALNEPAAHAPTTPAAIESDLAAAENDPATLELPMDFVGADAGAVQENATASHTDSAPNGAVMPAEQSAEPLGSDAAMTEDATASEAATDGDQAPDPATEDHSAAEPPAAGVMTGSSEESLASPSSTLTAADTDAIAALDSTLSADSADSADSVTLPDTTPAAEAAGTDAGAIEDNGATPAALSPPAPDEAAADSARDPADDNSVSASKLALTAETDATLDGPPTTVAEDSLADSPATDDTTVATMDSPPMDNPEPPATQRVASDEMGTTAANPSALDQKDSAPSAASADLATATTSDPQAAPTPFGEPPTLADPPDTSAAAASPTEVEAPVAEVGSLSAEASTSHLGEDDAPTVAAPVPGEAFPALQPGAVVAGRYTITQVLQTGPQRQTYLATDGQGYLRCWACGSRDNIQGELYCTNCGAQLTGRSYRLFETPPGTPAGEIAPPLLENLHSGVAGVFDSLTDPANGRHYLVLEDVGGKSLALTLAPPTGSADPPPTPDHLLTWIAAATQTLAELHAAQVVGCDFTPQALGVLPDDRLVLVDPSACRMAGAVGDDRSAGVEQQADVQRVAATLEQWLTATTPADENTAALTPVVPAPAARRPPPTEDTIYTILARGREGFYKTAAELAAAVHDLLAADQPPSDLQLISGRATDVGVQRKLNEDSLFALETVTIETSRSTLTALYIVADGMGGHESGEVASSIAVRTIPAMLNSLLDARVHGESGTPDQAILDEAVREAILEANRRIAELGRQRQSDMGTTVTMALVMGNRVTVANVGDSRTYLWRDGKLHQISEDHSLVARLIAAGQLTAEEGRHFERRNEIYRALGDGHLTPADVDVFHAQLRPLDALVLCSDGLWEMVRDADIEQIMLDAPDPPAATQALIAAANKAGGEDNITVIIAQTLTSSEDADA